MSAKKITTKPLKKGEDKTPPSVVKVSSFKLNDKNPRYVRDSRFEKLVKSIAEFPKMMELRPIVYDPQNMVVLGGNMRLRAIRKLRITDAPACWFKSADELTDAEKERFIIEDNIGFGEWDYDVLANDGWSTEDLTNWGMELPAPVAEPEFKEYGEDAADEVNLCKCDKCGHSHAAKN